MKYEIAMTPELFRRKLVSDLKGVVANPLIFESPGAKFLQQTLRHAVERFLDRDPERIYRMLGPPEVRLPLGKWYERILFLALKIAFPFDQIDYGIKTNDGGELDFVLGTAFQSIHIECAVKFYLHHPSRGLGLDSFVGPGGQDRLDLKLRKIQDVQLARVLPDSLNQRNQLQKLLWMGGALFFPFNNFASGIQIQDFDDINPATWTGFWISKWDIHLLQALNTDAIYLIPRLWWMTRLDEFTADDLKSFERLVDAVLPDEPMMVVAIRFEGGLSYEKARGFIVPC
jgi:hypothetical protein